MGFRFRKSLRLAPGVRINLSGSGASLSLGGRGATVNIGRRGIFGNVGIPGTGLSFRERLDGGRSRTRPEPMRFVPREAPTPEPRTMEVTVRVEDSGQVVFIGPDGADLPPALVTRVKQQHPEGIAALLRTTCEKMNSDGRALGHLHRTTPDPRQRPTYEPSPFPEAPPAPPTAKVPRFWERFWPGRRAQIDETNAFAKLHWRQDANEWFQRKQKHERQESRRRAFLERHIYENEAAMAQHLAATLLAIKWPRETLASFDLADQGGVAWLDVDLPEVEDMPPHSVAVAKRELRLLFEDLTLSERQQLYAEHVHSVGFRIIGETFAALPKVHTVVLSAYSQRASKLTGAVNDEYLYSVRVGRSHWETLNFNNLVALDVVDAMGQFELRRTISANGAFKAIEPFAKAAPVLPSPP